jgi:hypothetical protein
MYGMLASLGIEKGKPFEPDQRMKSILERASKAGLNYMETQAFADRTDESVIKVYSDRQWEWVYLGDDPDFEYATFMNLEARSRWFYQATGASPAMVKKSLGVGALYWLGHRDSSGNYLNGSDTYKLSIPTNVPGQLFWSITVYNTDRRSMIWTDQNQAALRSLFEDFKQNQDGSIDLYFGPQAPDGFEGQWIKTEPGKDWFAYWRIYGPTQEAFDKSWKLKDFERVL